MCVHDYEPQSVPNDAGMPAPEMDEWFAVSGDMDDFIFFGDDSKAHSEK